MEIRDARAVAPEMATDGRERVTLAAALLVEQAADDRIAMRFVRAGQTMPIRGFPKGVIFSADALRDAAAAGR